MIVPPLKCLRAGRTMREMNLLSAIGSMEQISQRKLAALTRLSTTMVNGYLNELVDRGLVRMSGETNRDTRYHLTAAGRNRLGELVHVCSREIIQLYGLFKREFQFRLEALAAEGIRRVVLYGAAETCEVMVAASPDTGVEIIGVVDGDPDKWGRRIGGHVVEAPGAIPGHRPDAVVVTSHGHADEIERVIRPLEARGIRVRRAGAGAELAEPVAATA